MSLVLFAVFPREYTHLYIGITLILVSFFNAFQEYYQKFKSEELLKGLMVRFKLNWGYFYFFYRNWFLIMRMLDETVKSNK